MKVTFHINNPLDFPFTFANEVAFACGGNVNMHALRVASCFDYIFHFVNDRNTGAKILAGIYKMEADKVAETIEIQSLLLYDFEKGTWSDKPRKMTKTVYSLSTKTANDSCSIAIGECWDGAGA